MQKLKRHLKKVGVTQKKLAELSGLNEMTICCIINKKTSPKLDSIKAILKALNKKYKDIF